MAPRLPALGHFRLIRETLLARMLSAATSCSNRLPVITCLLWAGASPRWAGNVAELYALRRQSLPSLDCSSGGRPLC